ncbi:hypothetical protein [Geothrix sp.]|uniref:hypothetical protein n=1 Tax=Geothrix sp. TaxID=1962974 RepID=UPI002614F279|nr:hypothetical protein [Geothrix sp.]WIL19439.1 MAG: hypothetical protein QOZ81_001956 [Geothrix sp.]
MKKPPISIFRLLPITAALAFSSCFTGSWPPAVSTKAQIEKLPVTQQDIRAIHIHDQELRLIAERFPDLDYLFVSPYADISDEGISYLSKLPKLRQVVIDNGSRLSDQSIRVLSALPSLRELMLSNAPRLSDTSLDLLSQRKKLTYLYLPQSKQFSESAKATIKKSLPGCKIDF